MAGKKALFLRFSSLGDVIISNYYAMQVKQENPQWEITWLVDSVYAPLVRVQPWVDSVIEWDRGGTGNAGFLKILKRVRQSGFDILIDMHCTDRTNFFACLCGIPVKYGRERKNIPFKIYTHDISASLTGAWERHEKCHRYLAAGPASEKVASFFGSGASMPTLILAIGASYEKKRWPVENWTAFARLAVAKGYRPALVGSGKDEEAAAGLIESSLKPGSVINTVGKLNITELAQAVGKGDFTISGDTGPLHIARALGIPTIGMFGPSLVAKSYMESLHHVFYSTCGEIGCGRWQCGRPCLGTIKPDSVMSCVEDYFAREKDMKNAKA